MKTLKPFIIRYSTKFVCIVIETPNINFVKGVETLAFMETIQQAYQWLLDNNFIDSLPTDKPQPNNETK